MSEVSLAAPKTAIHSEPYSNVSRDLISDQMNDLQKEVTRTLKLYQFPDVSATVCWDQSGSRQMVGLDGSIDASKLELFKVCLKELQSASPDVECDIVHGRLDGKISITRN